MPIVIIAAGAALIGAVLTIVGKPRMTRHPHWQLATIALLIGAATLATTLSIHNQDHVPPLVAATGKSSNWATAVMALVVAIYTPLGVRIRRQWQPTHAHWMHPARLIEHWQTRHILTAGAMMTAVLCALTAWSMADPAFDRPALKLALPSMTVLSFLSVLIAFSWHHAMIQRARDTSGETPEETNRLDNLAIDRYHDRRQRQIRRWANRISAATMTPLAIAAIANTANSALAPGTNAGEPPTWLAHTMIIAFLAGLFGASIALSTAKGSPFRVNTWSWAAALQAAGAVTVVTIILMATMGADTQDDRLNAAFTIATAAIAAGSLLAAWQDRKPRQDDPEEPETNNAATSQPA